MNRQPLELFSTRCHLGGTLQVAVRPPGQGPAESYSFQQPFVLVGSAMQNDLRVPTGPRRQAYLQVIGGRVFFLSLAGAVQANGAAAPCQSLWLDPGQTVDLASGYRLQLLNPAGDWSGTGLSVLPPDWNPLAHRTRDRALVAPVALELLEKGTPRLHWRVSRVLALIGRSPACKLSLKHPSVSWLHAALLATPDAIWVIDLLSREGVHLNGERMRWARLEDGDFLQIGSYQIRFRTEANGPEAGSAPTTFPLLPPRAAPAPALLTGPAEISTRPEQALLAPLLQQFGQMQQQMFEQFQQSLMMMAQMFCTMHQEQAEIVRAEMAQLRNVTQELQQLRLELSSNPAKATGSVPRALWEVSPAPTADGPALPASSLAAIPSAEDSLLVEPGSSSPQDAAGQGVHAWLGQRIAQLEQERQGRWQRLVNFFTGK